MTLLDFATLFDTYYPKLYAFIRSRVIDQKTAEDITASTFERAFSRSHTYDPDKGAFSTWLFSIARNLIVNHYAAAERQPAQFDLDEMTDLAASTLSPEAQLVRQEQQRQLLDLLNILSERDQEILQLRFFGHLTNRHIATMLDLNEKTVSVIILRALRKLKMQLEQQESV